MCMCLCVCVYVYVFPGFEKSLRFKTAEIDVQRNGREMKVEGGRDNGREQQQTSDRNKNSPSYSSLI